MKAAVKCGMGAWQMKAVIVYYSMGGNTAYAAQKIADRLDADLIRLSPVKRYPDRGFRKFLWGGKSAVMAETPALEPYAFQAERYDTVIFGFPVWAGSITPPLRTFVRDNPEGLRGRHIAAFACEGGSGAEKAFGKLQECLGIDALAAKMILIDPKDRPKPDTEEKIGAFCDQIRAL